MGQYQHPEIFNDNITGAILGCDYQEFSDPAFVTAPGWDPVVGLG
jgi:hypothetical protein